MSTVNIPNTGVPQPTIINNYYGSPTSSTSTLSKIDEGLLKCGKLASGIYLVLGIIISIALIGFGYYMYSKTDNMNEVQAIVTDVQCSYNYDTKRRRNVASCVLLVKYMVNNAEYTSRVQTQEEQHYTDEKITIKYDTTNPRKVSYKQMSNNQIGKYIMIAGVIMALLTGLHTYLMKTSDWYKRIVCVNIVGDVLF
jgi:hypothetical protein